MKSNHSARRRYTAAHWGSYEVCDDDTETPLQPLASDPLPSRVGRGWVSAMQDSRVRIARPSIRKGWMQGDKGAARHDDAYVEMPWDEALDMVANELRRVKQSFGNKALFAGSYGWASAGRFHHAQSQMRRFLNLVGGYVSARDTYSHAAGEVILPHITGKTIRGIENGQTSWPLVAEHCTMMLAFGGVSARTAQIASGGTSQHEVADWMAKAAANGMKTVCISPQHSDIAQLPHSRWLPVRAGSDVALQLALCHELFVHERHDEAFLERYTSGWRVFQDYVLGKPDGVAKSADWASPLCDIPADTIKDLAKQMAEEKVMVSVAWGMQRSDHGEQPVWAGLALACLLGQIGQPGNGFGFGYGSTTPPGRPKRFIGWPSVPQGTNPIDDFIPVARIADMLLKPGESYAYNGQTRTYPDIKLVYWTGGNPFHHHQDLFRLEQAWTRPQTIIVHDHSWTATARRADIVLPSTSPLERDDLMINRRDPKLIYMSQIHTPFEEARHDHDIFAGLAKRLNVYDAFTEGRDVAGWLEWLWSQCQETARSHKFELPDLASFQQQGLIDLPDQDAVRNLFEDFIADPHANRLETHSGKLTLFNETIAAMQLDDCPGHPSWHPPLEWTYTSPERLHLLSIQPDTRLHGQLDNGTESYTSKHQGREVCRLHPDTAARYGLSEGDVARLFNARGACLVSVSLDAGLRSDCVVLPTGAWFDPQDSDTGRLCVHGNPNVLTIDRGASHLSQGPIAHTCLVDIEKWHGALPVLRCHDAPPFETAETG